MVSTFHRVPTFNVGRSVDTKAGKNCTLMNAPRGIFATFPPQASARFIAGIGPVANYTIARPSCQKNYTVISVSLNLISRLPRCRDTVNFLSEPSLKLPHRSTSVCVPAFYYTRYRATRCHGDIQRSDTPWPKSLTCEIHLPGKTGSLWIPLVACSTLSFSFSIQLPFCTSLCLFQFSSFSKRARQ